MILDLRGAREKSKEGWIIAADKIRQRWRRVSNKTNRTNVMIEVGNIDSRLYGTSEIFGFRSNIGELVIFNEQMIRKWYVGEICNEMTVGDVCQVVLKLNRIEFPWKFPRWIFPGWSENTAPNYPRAAQSTCTLLLCSSSKPDVVFRRLNGFQCCSGLSFERFPKCLPQTGCSTPQC